MMEKIVAEQACPIFQRFMGNCKTHMLAEWLRYFGCVVSMFKFAFYTSIQLTWAHPAWPLRGAR